MQGYQFAHVETWSIAGASGTVHHGDHTRPNGQKAWTAQQILDEAERLPGSSFHVDPWGERPQILAGNVAGFEELRAAHAEASSISETFDYTDPKTRKKSQRRRKLRKDARTLYTAVFSLPVETTEARGDPLVRERCLAVLEEAIDHERERVELAGGRYMMGVVHWDERHVHAHFYALDPVRGRVNHLHPGAAAKDAFVNDPRHATLKKKDRNAGGDRAYCEAMRDWQRTLHEEVFKGHGLLRVGPRRERLSRPDYLHAKQAAAERLEDRERRHALDLRAADLEDFGTQMLAGMTEDIEAQRAWNDDLEARSSDLDDYADELLEARRRVHHREEECARRDLALTHREATLRNEEAALTAARAQVSGHQVRAAEAEAEATRKLARADAELAAIEAVAADVVEVRSNGDRHELVPRSGSKNSTMWEGLRRRMQAAPDAAIRTAARVQRSFEMMRAAALDRARLDARQELETRSGQVEKLWRAVGSTYSGLKAIFEKLTPDQQRQFRAAEQEVKRTAAERALASRGRAPEQYDRG